MTTHSSIKQRLKHWHTPIAACGLVGAMLSACAGAEPISEGENFGGTDEEIGPLGDEAASSAPAANSDGHVQVAGDVIAKVALDNGAQFMFIRAGGGVGVLEGVPAGVAGFDSFPALKHASVADMYMAVSEPGSPIPDAIKSSSVDNGLGQQGWMRAEIAAGNYAAPRGVCTDSTFTQAVQSYGYNDRGTPSLRLNQSVGSSGFFAQHIECFGTSWTGGCPQFYRYEVGGNNGSVWSDVDQYYTRVAVCGLGSHPTITSNYGTVWTHPGPQISAWYRDASNASWNIAFSVDVAANQVGIAWAWHSGTALNHDWRTRIELAKANDYFDIGHAVEDL